MIYFMGTHNEAEWYISTHTKKTFRWEWTASSISQTFQVQVKHSEIQVFLLSSTVGQEQRCAEPLYCTFLAFPLPPPAPLCSLLYSLERLGAGSRMALSQTMQEGWNYNLNRALRSALTKLCWEMDFPLKSPITGMGGGTNHLKRSSCRLWQIAPYWTYKDSSQYSTLFIYLRLNQEVAGKDSERETQIRWGVKN